MLKDRLLLISCLLGIAGLLVACNIGASPREQSLEATVTALQNQVVTSSAPVSPATVTPVAALDWRKQFIGIKVPPVPEGWVDGREETAFSTCKPPAPCAFGEEDYRVALWRQRGVTQNTVETLLLFKKLVGYDPGGAPITVILDVLVGSEIEGDDEFLLVVNCRIDDNPKIDEEIHVALFSGGMDPPARAWRANHLTGRFEEVSTEGLFCIDDSAAD